MRRLSGLPFGYLWALFNNELINIQIEIDGNPNSAQSRKDKKLFVEYTQPRQATSNNSINKGNPLCLTGEIHYMFTANCVYSTNVRLGHYTDSGRHTRTKPAVVAQKYLFRLLSRRMQCRGYFKHFPP